MHVSTSSHAALLRVYAAENETAGNERHICWLWMLLSAFLQDPVVAGADPSSAAS